MSSIFLVPKPDGSYRLILNLKKLNEFIETDHFKLEDFRVAKRLISPGYFMGKLDLKDAYYAVSIHPRYRKYLRFTVEGAIYEFNCLPFGLNTAPYVFTKLTKPIVAHLRSLGFMSVIYLDDMLLFGETISRCAENIRITSALLERLGFVINAEKSCTIPAQRCLFLGFIYDSIKMTLELPAEKRTNIHEQILVFKNIRRCSIRDFARFLGLIVSACPAIQYGLVYMKNLERAKHLALLKSNGNYNSVMKLEETLKPDLLWWENNILWRTFDIAHSDFELEIFSDASSTGWGVSCNKKRTHGHWDQKEKRHHINYLELLAAFFGLRCVAKDLRKCRILLRIDNTTAIAYINRMGGVRFPELSKLAKSIWKWCESREICLFASYIASKHNVEADFESRQLEKGTEYELSSTAFNRIRQEFGAPVIDLFATRINAKCQQFVSWLRDPDAVTADAFTISWKEFFFYAFPPVIVLTRVLQKIRSEGSKGIVVVPYWPAQPWFPLFIKMLESEPIFFRPNKNLLRSSNREEHPLWRKITLVAGKLSGERS